MGDSANNPVLETARLRLRAQAERDAPVFHQLWTERDPRVPPYRRIDNGRPSVQDIEADIRSGTQATDLLTLERKDTSRVIGYCGLVFTGTGEPHEPQLGFELLRGEHNQGYATEAGRAIVAWATEIGHPRLWASVWDWNVASRRALEKLGFREVGEPGPDTAHGRSLLTVLELDAGSAARSLRLSSFGATGREVAVRVDRAKM